MTDNNTHLVIPDTQVKPGTPVAHLHALGRLIQEHQPDTIIHLGDHWDMPSLSGYDGVGSKSMEGRRYIQDIDAGNRAMDILNEYIHSVQGYSPRLVFLMGNHEHRIERAIETEPRKLDGVIGYADFTSLSEGGWETHEYLEVVKIDGVFYSHAFVNQFSGKPIGGTVQNRLNKLKCSFTQGHVQMFQYGEEYLQNGRVIQGVVAGAFYMHNEDYKGPQGNNHWRGVIYKSNVDRGTYDLEMIRLQTLLRDYGE